jgi:hypothetical protein
VGRRWGVKKKERWRERSSPFLVNNTHFLAKRELVSKSLLELLGFLLKKWFPTVM